MNTWQFHLLNWQGVGPMWAICFFCLHKITCLSIPVQPLLLNLTYWLKYYLLLAFCFLYVCMVDQTQMCPPPSHP